MRLKIKNKDHKHNSNIMLDGLPNYVQKAFLVMREDCSKLTDKLTKYKNKEPIAYVVECPNLGPGSVGNDATRKELWWAHSIERALRHPTLYTIISTLYEGE